MKVITISREYGAGGHSVGQKVADILGVELYDHDIITATAKSSGIDIDQIRNEEESISKADSFIRAITPMGYDSKDIIFEHESQVICDLAAKGPCVIIGRCANVILEDAGIEHLGVFLYADVESRIPHVGELIGTDNRNEIVKLIKRADNARHAYFTHYTGRQWADVHGYNLAIDTGNLSYDAAAELIAKAAQ